MKKILFLLIFCCLGFFARAQSTTDLLGDYVLETNGLQGSLKLRRSADVQQPSRVTLLFQGQADAAPQSYQLGEQVVDGALQQFDEKAVATVPFTDMIVRTTLESGVRYIVVYTADGLDYRFRRL